MTMEQHKVTGLVAHRLRVECTAETAIVLPLVRGPVLRGALVGALLADFCPVRGGEGCGSPELAAACPVCTLLASGEEGQGAESTRAGRDDGRHGVDAPRPFTVEPPLGGNGAVAPGDPLSFGLTLFGDSVGLFPYLLAGIARMGQAGIGDRHAAPGRFRPREVWAIDPLQGVQQRLMSDLEETMAMPTLPITHAAVLERAARLPTDAVALELLTPLRLVTEGRLVHRLTFQALLRRLLRRLDQLSMITTAQGLDIPFSQLIEAAGAVRVVNDETRWLDASSHSSRTGRTTPIGGLVGRVVFSGDLAPFLPWLVWGEIIHVGKDATKGNGWYRLSRARAR